MVSFVHKVTVTVTLLTLLSYKIYYGGPAFPNRSYYPQKKWMYEMLAAIYKKKNQLNFKGVDRCNGSVWFTKREFGKHGPII